MQALSAHTLLSANHGGAYLHTCAQSPTLSQCVCEKLSLWECVLWRPSGDPVIAAAQSPLSRYSGIVRRYGHTASSELNMSNTLRRCPRHNVLWNNYISSPSVDHRCSFLNAHLTWQLSFPLCVKYLLSTINQQTSPANCSPTFSWSVNSDIQTVSGYIKYKRPIQLDQTTMGTTWCQLNVMVRWLCMV